MFVLRPARLVEGLVEDDHRALTQSFADVLEDGGGRRVEVGVDVHERHVLGVLGHPAGEGVLVQATTSRACCTSGSSSTANVPASKSVRHVSGSPANESNP